MAKKHLGQHFLTSKKFVSDIVHAANITPEDTVVEIGPGKGALTEALLKKAGRVVAIEKDTELIPLLEERFEKEIADGRLTLISGDILEVGIGTFIDETYSIVANIPYYITGQVLRIFLEHSILPRQMTLLVQKEVAERIATRDKKQSLLSISVSAYGIPHVVEKVPARYFLPQPKVDSAIITIENISRKFFDVIQEPAFFEFIRAGFTHKRKKLMSNLKVLYPEDILRDAFKRCSVSENSRAEELDRESWKCLLLHLQK